ncbi:MAG: signal peptidase II [Alphaproteobacteria bacterium]
MQQFLTLRARGLFVAVVALVADVVSKQAALLYLLPLGSVPVLNLGQAHLWWTFAWNKGVSFSFLANVQQPLVVPLLGLHIPAEAYIPALLSTLAFVAIALFLWLLAKEATWWGQAGMGLIIGGAFGNVADRLQHGAVVDFIHVFYGQYGQGWHFPVFNMADSCITVGVILLICESLVHNARTHNKLNKGE